MYSWSNVARSFVVKASFFRVFLAKSKLSNKSSDAHIKKRVPNPLTCISNISYRNSVNPNRKKCMGNSLERGQQQLSQSGHMSYFSARTVWRARSLNHAHASFSSSRCFRSQVRSYGCEIILKSCSRIFQLFQIF